VLGKNKSRGTTAVIARRKTVRFYVWISAVHRYIRIFIILIEFNCCRRGTGWVRTTHAHESITRHVLFVMFKLIIYVCTRDRTSATKELARKYYATGFINTIYTGALPHRTEMVKKIIYIQV